MNETEINKVRENADIVEIISDYIPLTQKGKNYFAICPFHQDHNPSLVVSKEKQIFNCFTCHTGGNVFTFVMKYENVSFPEAVKIVADKIGVDIKINNHALETKNIFKTNYEIMDLANNFFMNNLNTAGGLEAKKYLKDRGIDEEIIKSFKLGFALDGKDELYNFLISQNYDIKNIDEVGLVNKSGLNVYDTFKNRVMIPITNLNNQVVGFTGRIFHNEPEAKYINTKETVIFKKGEIIFNYYNARNYIREAQKAIIVEGNMDAIKMYASGIKNVIALMGVALTDFHIKALRKLNVPIVLMLDNDDAGLNGTIKNGDILYKSGLKTEVVRLSGAKDPDEYIRAFGVEKLQDAINHSISYIDFKINTAKIGKDLSSPADLATYIKEIESILQGEDELVQKVIYNKIAGENNIPIELFTTTKKIEEQHEIEPINIVLNIKKRNKLDEATDKILYYMLNDSRYIKSFANELGYLPKQSDRELAGEIIYYDKHHEAFVLPDFLSSLQENQELSDKCAKILSIDEQNLDYNDFLMYIKAVKKEINRLEIIDLKRQIKNEMDLNKKLELMKKLTELKKGCVDNG